MAQNWAKPIRYFERSGISKGKYVLDMKATRLALRYSEVDTKELILLRILFYAILQERGFRHKRSLKYK